MKKSKWKFEDRQAEHFISATVKTVITSVDHERIMDKRATHHEMF